MHNIFYIFAPLIRSATHGFHLDLILCSAPPGLLARESHENKKKPILLLDFESFFQFDAEKKQQQFLALPEFAFQVLHKPANKSSLSSSGR